MNTSDIIDIINILKKENNNINNKLYTNFLNFLIESLNDEIEYKDNRFYILNQNG